MTQVLFFLEGGNFFWCSSFFFSLIVFHWLPVLEKYTITSMCKVKIKQFSETVGLEKLYFCFIIDFTENVLHTKSHFPVQMKEGRVSLRNMKNPHGGVLFLWSILLILAVCTIPQIFGLYLVKPFVIIMKK